MDNLKSLLSRAPVIGLPNPTKTFQFYAQKKEDIALGVLTQKLGTLPTPGSEGVAVNRGGGQPLLYPSSLMLMFQALF